jgi:hypothetical protein
MLEALEHALQSATSGDWDDILVLAPAHPQWRPRIYVPLLTRAFEEGIIQCLVGTRGLLGEGWDSQRVNVLVDLTAAGTTVAVHQMRGRSLRLDPSLPHKVADNWDVVCVAPDHPKGANDYVRFVHKHDHYFAPTTDGEIESGVSHVHHALSPFGPPELRACSEINSTMITRAHDRDGVYQRWAIGTPYENSQIETVRVRFGNSFGLPGKDLLRHASGSSPGIGERIRRDALGIAAAAIGAGIFGLLVGFTFALNALVLAGLFALGGVAVGVTVSGRGLLTSMSRLEPSDALEDLAAAVVDGLRDSGGVRPEIGAGAVRVVLQDDGYYRCYLAGATREESALFAESVDELLTPLASPRYIMARYIAPEPPKSAIGAFALAVRWAVRGRVSERVVYHAVPTFLAANKTRVRAFERAWKAHVSPGTAMYYQDPRAAAILEVQGGENPFAVTSQMRTLWQ